MAARTNDDGSEDVADFLERIRELGDTHAKEDEERTRKLEEEILQGRKERQARRAERARSISPTKDSPLSSSINAPPQPDSPTPKAKRESNMDRSGVELSPTRAARAKDAPIAEPIKPNPPANSSSIQRSGTLSWQQRPDTTRSSPTIRTRPAPVSENETTRQSPQEAKEATSPGAQDSSREQAAAILRGKDPSWFRQTEDRGKQSAAYRKNQDSSAVSSGSVRLHGLGGPSSGGAVAGNPHSASSSRSPSPERGTTSVSEQPNIAASPMPVLSSQRFRPPESPASEERPASPQAKSPAASPTHGRFSPERMDRPSSPTKGLGGFVQSAMMKRSDSVSKRWSGQAGSTRGATVSNEKNSASNVTEDVNRGSTTSATSGIQSPDDIEGLKKHSAPRPMTSQSPEPAKGFPSESAEKPPANVNQSSEAKRWSPSKSSWLEAAINKSDPPKPKAAAPSQPSWMAEINKAKQARLGAGVAKDTGASSTVGDSSGDAGSRPSSNTKASATSSTDLRGSLRSRAPPAGGSQSGEPEFKNVFGKLKKAETKNYVAPDELKNNITRGKAALNVTGGPRPWVKKDEFKDSILAKKKEMKEGTSVVNTGNVAAAAAAEVPEAIAKRGNMSVREPGGKDAPRPTVPAPKPKPAPKPSVSTDAKPVGSEATATRSKFAERSKPTSPPNKPTSPEIPSKRLATEKQPTAPAASPKLSTASSTELPSIQSTTQSSLPRETSKGLETTLSKSTGIAPPKPSSSASGKRLVDRLNPALASIIARGPPGSQDAQGNGEGAAPGSGTQALKQKEAKLLPEATPAAALTHTTKSRARGPKRRLPKSITSAADSDHTANNVEAKNAEESPSPSRSGAATNGLDSTGTVEAESSKNKPAVASDGSQRPIKPAQQPVTEPSKEATSSPKAKPSIPDIKPTGAITTSEVSKRSPPTTASIPRAASPKEPIAPQSDAEKTAELAKVKSATGRLESPASPPKQHAQFKPPDKAKTDPVSKIQPKSPPTPGKKPLGLARVKSEGSESFAVQGPEKIESKSPRVSEVSHYLSEAFGQPLSSVAGNEYSTDTQAILQKARVADKIKTQKKEIWEVTGDGKMISVPPHQEHILFNNSMFLCTHTYEAANGKRTTDVHLWVGSEISSSAVEDAQLFCRNSAKEAGGKLVVLNQGKEPPTLFEALGGIVITRKGSPSSAASSRYMLCGRRHLGHVAFDEVNFSPNSLFSGFTYIVASADGSKLFLWKGKGSGTDVVGCARLIAMDLGVTGNVEEIDDGSEPASFWKAFGAMTHPARSRASSGTDASWEKYRTRLFAIDADARPKSSSGFLGWARRTSTPVPEDEGGVVREIYPFAQSDLSAEGIFVVDAFFELYVIVGSKAFSKLSSLHTAVYFAQEYGVLAASLEDRPFIPSSQVILGGMTEGVKHAFRCWDDKRSPAAAKEKIVDLNEVLGAFSDAK